MSDERSVLPVTADNFVRAESDTYFRSIAARYGVGRLGHDREPTSIDKQTVIRLNRDTLYSAGIFDLEAGPLTVTLPDAGGRFRSMQIIDQDHYTHLVTYEPGTYTFTKGGIGTRYILVAMRTLVDPTDPADIRQVHALQDAVKVEQASAGEFDAPHWDPVSQKKVRDALLELASTLPDTNGMFGSKGEVEPVRHLVGAAMGWGGNPAREATYLNVTPAQNDGVTVHRLTVKDVPVDAFWSISVYNAEGYFEKNERNAYTLNNLTARQDADGAVTVQFGGCDGEVANCLPITPGWNYMVRLYRPRPGILNGEWTFPQAQVVK